MNEELEMRNDRELYLAALGMDLQWFAAEDEGRTHDPTETTFRKAREEGRVAKSQELVAALGLLFPGIVLIFIAPWMLRTCAEMLRFFLTRLNDLDPITDRMTAGVVANYYVRLALPILTVAMVAALFSNLIQVGFLFSTKPLQPDFTKVLPKFGKYFGRIFSVEGLFNFGKSVFKMLVIGSVAFFLIRSHYKELVNLQTTGLWEGLTLIASLAGRLLLIAAFLLLALSVPDAFFQRWQFRESLKMTREAAKEELKQEDGDPQMRSRLRSRYRDILSRNMLNAVPTADVVITNPTHYSVALLFDWEEYDAGIIDGPKVVAKGEDDMAFRIREVAKEHGVPVVSHPPLTRTLYNETEIGDQIPYRYLQVVAVILNEFFLFNEKKERARRSAAAAGGRIGA